MSNKQQNKFKHMYSVVISSSVVALLPKYLPTGILPEDAKAKIVNELKSQLGNVSFTEKAGKEGAKPKRLKLDHKKQTAAYTTSMIGSTQDKVHLRAMDLYDFLWDVVEFESQWGQMTPSIPPQLAEYITGLCGNMKPRAEKKTENKDQLQPA